MTPERMAQWSATIERYEAHEGRKALKRLTTDRAAAERREAMRLMDAHHGDVMELFA